MSLVSASLSASVHRQSHRQPVQCHCLHSPPAVSDRPAAFLIASVPAPGTLLVCLVHHMPHQEASQGQSEELSLYVWIFLKYLMIWGCLLIFCMKV